MTNIKASIVEKGDGVITNTIANWETQMSKESVIEIFKQKVVAAGKSATITEQEDGSVRMIIHCKS